mmetsp:Transcript_22163/g.61692  ORF Transcript_22163/g.61692 Transcript_22163/m.61692 type:complete len:106 (+) Transcript_22163:585-902(+)
MSLGGNLYTARNGMTVTVIELTAPKHITITAKWDWQSRMISIPTIVLGTTREASFSGYTISSLATLDLPMMMMRHFDFSIVYQPFGHVTLAKKTETRKRILLRHW